MVLDECPLFLDGTQLRFLGSRHLLCDCVSLMEREALVLFRRCGKRVFPLEFLVILRSRFRVHRWMFEGLNSRKRGFPSEFLVILRSQFRVHYWRFEGLNWLLSRDGSLPSQMSPRSARWHAPNLQSHSKIRQVTLTCAPYRKLSFSISTWDRNIPLCTLMQACNQVMRCLAASCGIQLI